MNPLRLYIENFFCHDRSFIDFSLFDSALIMATINDNDELSNGAGKSTIFKAIEYVLFNKSDVVLNSLIRDGSKYCKVTFDFESDGVVYRIMRKKTLKSAEFNLFRKINNDSSFTGIKLEPGMYEATDASKLEEHWKNLSTNRGGDTKKELDKLLNINFKSFRNTVHFVQDDIDSLAKSTPEQRKKKFKESLQLSIYPKLEELAKKKLSKLTKEFEKNEILIENIGDPSGKIKELNEKLYNIELELKDVDASDLIDKENNLIDEKKDLEFKINQLKTSVSSLVSSKQALTLEINKLESSIEDKKIKINESSKSGKNMILEIKSLKEKKDKLISIDFSKIKDLENKVIDAHENLNSLSALIKINTLKQSELKVPFPEDNLCKHCRQEMTLEHREACQKEIDKQLIICEKEINDCNAKIASIKNRIKESNEQINQLKSAQKELDRVDVRLNLIKEQLKTKKTSHGELQASYDEKLEALSSKKETLKELDKKIDKSSSSNIKKLENEVVKLNNLINIVTADKLKISKQKAHLQNNKAVIEYEIKEKHKAKKELEEFVNNRDSFSKKMKHYPSVIQAFSSTGIPNLIIQNVLDDLQLESNNLLNQLKPGLQLEFIIEKEKSSDDTLDIVYYVNGKKRYYEQLSGAMKLSVMFSLKIGLSYLLQRMMGFNMPILLLDEVDQVLDKAGVDAFANIIKFFQNDFKVLVITHNDRLKSKFNNVILVRQDTNATSRAKVEV